MPVNVLMPALSPTMTEGNLAKWHVKEGDEVNTGDVIAEIETDKATMEVEAVDEGRVGRILVAEGSEGVKVNEPIAILLEEGESEGDLDEAPAAPAPPDGEGEGGGKSGDGGGAAAQKDAPAAGEQAPSARKQGGAPGTRESLEQAPPAPPAPKDAEGKRVFASPLARRMANQAGLDLTRMNGSGPHGRIVRADVEQAIERGVGAAAKKEEKAPQKAPETAPPAAEPAAGGPSAKEQADMFGLDYEEVQLSSMRKTIARRLSESKQSVPHFYLSLDIEMDELMKVRRELNERAERAAPKDGKPAYKLSVNDFIIRACALALMQVPAANVSFNGKSALMYKHADISVAVAIDAGLITPIVKRAESKGLVQISSEMKDLAKRARDGKLKPEDYQGGTFSLSNLGMFGISQFEAIINPPQGCILAVGKSEQRPVVKDGALAVATMMTASLSVDHRVVDGAIGAEFLAALKKLLEDPLTMLL